ncbi:MAG: hypothetical protein ACOYL5_05330 [Phototrophicaceae bacterium]|jgi:hypothetical protein
MPIQLMWDTPTNQIVRVSFQGGWSWSDFQEMLTVLTSLLEGDMPAKGFIFAFSPTARPPRGNANIHLKRLQRYVEGKPFWVVTSDAAIKMQLNQVFEQIGFQQEKQYHYVASVIEARLAAKVALATPTAPLVPPSATPS